MSTVVVCDTEPVAIEGLRGLLESVNGLRVVAAETTLPDGVEAVRELQPQLVVVDKAFGMPGVVGFLRALRESGLETAAVVWSAALSEVEAVRLLQAGASGVVRKTSSLGTLLECFKRVAAGASWMEDDFLREADMGGPSRRSALTSREAEVMGLVERGLKNKDIAESLGIRVGTVKIHLKHIFEKTGVRGRYGLAISGLKEKGLLTTTPV